MIAAIFRLVVCSRIAPLPCSLSSAVTMFPREVFFLSQLPGAWVARSVGSAVWRDVSVWQHLSRTQGCALYLMQSFLSDGESLGEHGEIGLEPFKRFTAMLKVRCLASSSEFARCCTSSLSVCVCLNASFSRIDCFSWVTVASLK